MMTIIAMAAGLWITKNFIGPLISIFWEYLQADEMQHRYQEEAKRKSKKKATDPYL